MVHQELAGRLRFVGLDEGQRAALAGARDSFARHAHTAIATLYAAIDRTPEVRSFFRDTAHIGAAKSLQEQHWARLWSGRFDAEYHDSVRRIGSVHARIGLEPRWYIGSYAIVLGEMLRALLPDRGRGGSGRFGRGGATDAEAIVALVRAALVDLELCVSVYFEQAQQAQREAMAALEEREAALGELLASVGAASANVLESSDAIAESADQLARRTESNAASLEETSAAIAQIDTRLRATAAAATRTVERADGALATVEGGRAVAEEAVHAMGRVSESATGIDGVIEGLDKIAFQTRVLAMNAAVEAGRAGEAGRGFAVVADLVSALAMRAEEEAKRARDQLTVTQTEIVSAVGAVQRVDGALAGITGDVREVHALLEEMAADNQAQSTAVSQITSAVETMDAATQQCAAMVQETSAAARVLRGEASTLAARARSRDEGAEAAPIRRSTAASLAVH